MYGSWVLLIILIISSIPVILIYIWFRLSKYQFSIVWFLLAMLAGAAAFFPALILQDFLNFSIYAGGRLEFFYHVFIRIAFTEELSRLLMLFVFFMVSRRIMQTSYHENSWSAVNKGAATGLVAGLGFAILESATYAASDTGVLLLRAVTTAPLHAACGSRVGMAAVMFRSKPIQSIMRLITATVIHGIYNLMIVIPGLPSIVALLIAFSALASSMITIRNNWNTEENAQNNA
jgi:RsiW-degrading membrane proteinase PrsW (M82 family)